MTSTPEPREDGAAAASPRIIAIASTLLGLDPDLLRRQLRSGAVLSDLLTGSGVTTDELQTALHQASTR